MCLFGYNIQEQQAKWLLEFSAFSLPLFKKPMCLNVIFIQKNVTLWDHSLLKPFQNSGGGPGRPWLQLSSQDSVMVEREVCSERDKWSHSISSNNPSWGHLLAKFHSELTGQEAIQAPSPPWVKNSLSCPWPFRLSIKQNSDQETLAYLPEHSGRRGLESCVLIHLMASLEKKDPKLIVKIQTWQG